MPVHVAPRLAQRVGLLIGSLLVSLAVPSPAKAQRLVEIGKTSVGTSVFLEPKTVTTSNGITTAAVRVRLQPPLKHASGDLKSSRTLTMVDCTKQTLATKESWYYLDDAGTKVGLHKEVKIPGYGPAFKGSLADVAMRYLCAPPQPR